MTKHYRVISGGKRRYFETLQAAVAFCNNVFQKTGVVLGIEVV